MAILIRMPEIAANATSAVIASWSKKEGESVAAGDCLAEIETDKAVIELTAEHSGVLGKILVTAGNEVSVGVPIAVLYAQDGEMVDVEALLAAEGGVSQQADASVQDDAAPALLSKGEPGVATQRIFASPLARRMALEQGVDLSTLGGTGPRGRIVKRDVLSAVPNTMPGKQAVGGPAPPVQAADRTYTEIPHSAMRRTIARRLSESKATIPHFYLRADCHVDSLLSMRSQVNAQAGRKITVNDIIIKAVGAALRELPQMNVSWTDDGLRCYRDVDVAVAVSTDAGLITPIVQAVDGKPLSLVAAEIARLAERARKGELAPHEYQGGSFTVSNLGMFGVQEFDAIINPPQAAILAVGAVQQRPAVMEGTLIVASVMTVTLSVDHRAIDGVLAAKWLAVFKRIIENPLSALI